jgi:hypothetical protein
MGSGVNLLFFPGNFKNRKNVNIVGIFGFLIAQISGKHINGNDLLSL